MEKNRNNDHISKIHLKSREYNQVMGRIPCKLLKYGFITAAIVVAVIFSIFEYLPVTQMEYHKFGISRNLDTIVVNNIYSLNSCLRVDNGDSVEKRQLMFFKGDSLVFKEYQFLKKLTLQNDFSAPINFDITTFQNSLSRLYMYNNKKRIQDTAFNNCSAIQLVHAFNEWEKNNTVYSPTNGRVQLVPINSSSQNITYVLQTIPINGEVKICLKSIANTRCLIESKLSVELKYDSLSASDHFLVSHDQLTVSQSNIYITLCIGDTLISQEGYVYKVVPNFMGYAYIKMKDNGLKHLFDFNNNVLVEK